MAANPRRVKELFMAALDLPDASARQAFLERECGGDIDLWQRLEILLKAHDEPLSALERPLAAVEPPTVPPGTGLYHEPAEGVGAIIAGKYKLLEALGEGGMGTVFMAQQTAPVKRLVALKLIKLGMDSKQVLSRFEAERQALALMDHPNIAKVLDAGATESGRPFFVMELVKGVPITRFCDERQLSPRERLELFVPVCQAIQHAHQKGVIHRDIKPSNVLVALYDDRPVPKVIDFGVAKAAGSQLTDASLVTAFGAIVGTPEYMSPEQAQLNQLDIDTRSDVYALGVLLYELLTGTTPIDRKRLGQDALLEILRVIREEEPPRPSTRLSTSNARASIAATRRTEPGKLAKLLRGELDWIVMKCLEKERSRRYETANGLARDLERYLHDEIVEARPPSTGYRLRKFVRKHRAPFAMAAMVVLLLLAGVAVSMWQAVRARRAENAAAKALIEAEQNREEADQRRQQADEQRNRAETQAASVAMDMDLKYCEDGEIAVGLLRLAETLRTMPERATELRECARLNILAWGQRFRPAWPLNHDGFAVTEGVLSPDGQSVLCLGRDGTARLWDSLTGKQRAILGQPPGQLKDAPSGMIQFSKDGSTAGTLHGNDLVRGYSTGTVHFVSGGDGIVRLWDTATGQLRAATSRHSGSVFHIQISRDNSLLVTASSPSGPLGGQYTVFFWNARTGQLIRKLSIREQQVWIDVSPDGKSVLISRKGQFGVWTPDADQPRKQLPGTRAVFSPLGSSAVSVSEEDVLYWWNTADWQLHRTIKLHRSADYSARFLDEDILLVESAADMLNPPMGMVFLRNLPKPLGADAGSPLGGDMAEPTVIGVSQNGRLVVIGNHVYDAHSGQRFPLPRGRRYPPELSRLSGESRFLLLPGAFLVDLAADKPIHWGKRTGYQETSLDAHLLKKPDTWVALDAGYRPVVLHKADASLDAELLQKWCQILTRGKLDEIGRFSKFDEPTWEKRRLELAHMLGAKPQAQSLRSAATDSLYWLREEIADLEKKEPAAALALVDRLISAEPTWMNYGRRAALHAKLRHADLAIQDEFQAAHLAAERYWLAGSSITDWQIAALSVQAPGRPREQYERALRWVEARTRAGVSDEPTLHVGSYQPKRHVIVGLALYRLGRHADALSTLLSSEVPKLADAASTLISRWNVLRLMTYRSIGPGMPGERGLRGELEFAADMYVFDPVDVLVRAMCHHHLGHAEAAKACLNLARGKLPKKAEDINADQRAFLREAEALIEGKQIN